MLLEKVVAMNFEPDKRINLSYFSNKFNEYGQNVQALGWNSHASQQERFKVLCEIGNLNGKSILDIGCGFGDLYLFLKEQGIHPKRYIGIDMNPQMIATAKSRIPEAIFKIGDLPDSNLEERYDYVVASGIFSLETPNWEVIVAKIISKMYRLSRIGVGVNFLSSFTTGKKFADKHYAHPADMLNLIFPNLSTRVVLRHDYRPNDFTVYIYKPFAWKGSNEKV